MKLRQRALKLLARREYTRAELAQKLNSEDVDLNELNEVLDGLVRERLQSDARYAEMYVRQRMNRGYGPLRIAMELRERGIADELIDEHLHQAQFDWTSHLQLVWRRRFLGKFPKDLKEKARHIRFLQYRGFDYQDVYELFKN